MDKRQKELYEHYEDALFAIAMDQVAQETEKELDQEAQRLDAEGFQMPDALDQKCLALIQQARKDEIRRNRPAKVKRVLKTVLVVAVVMALLFSVAYATVPEFRAGFLNMFLKVTEVGTEIKLGDDTTIHDAVKIKLSYVPDGFELHSSVAAEDSSSKNVRYMDSEYNNFAYGYILMDDGGAVTWDTEDAAVTYTTLKGSDGMIVQKIEPIEGHECVDFVWINGDQPYLLYVSGYGLPYEEVEAIFDGLTIYS